MVLTDEEVEGEDLTFSDSVVFPYFFGVRSVYEHFAFPTYFAHIYALFESAGGIVRCLKEISTYGEDIVQPDEEESTEEGV